MSPWRRESCCTRRGASVATPQNRADMFDFLIIGAGPAGESAAFEACHRGASVAIVDRRWFGGSCPHIGCIPSKSLLNSAERHHQNPATWSWEQTSARRDWMINRLPDAAEPDDAHHVDPLKSAGAIVYRGDAEVITPGVVDVLHHCVTHLVEARNLVVAVGSRSKIPPVPGLEAVPVWTKP